ncbi:MULTISPECIES: hypothetical protein [Oceanisphaera]|uniref:Uncharacterized protein n=1 Tax=Oceanisphaera ostreae TaxID=914151 RepID=A0ABW3KC88_9GAMM
MNKAWCSGVFALMLTGCSLPFPPFQQPELETPLPQEAIGMQLTDWLQLSTKMMSSSEAQRQIALNHLQQAKDNALEQALWLSHPRASNSHRQQAQQLFKQYLSKATSEERQFLAVYQAYNEELLQQQRQLADRQQQVNSLTRKLNELANIDQQINERKFRE